MCSRDCVRCGARLPSNSLGLSWPFGRSLALDECHELCWAICDRCDAWTLGPDGTATELAAALASQPDCVDRLQFSSTVTELQLPEGVLILVRHLSRPKHDALVPSMPGRRRRLIAILLFALLAVGVLTPQLLRTDALWPYALFVALAVAVSVLVHAHRGSVQVATREGRIFALAEGTGAVLRWQAGGGWQLELGDTTPSGALRAMGRSRVTGFDALNVLQRLISFRLPDGAPNRDLKRAKTLFVERGNPFLSREPRDAWGDALPVNALDVPEQLALELAVNEALLDHQLRSRGRVIEQRFKAETKVARIVREELG